MSITDEHTKVVTALNIVDRSIAYHRDEIQRLWALRAALAARLESFGGEPPQISSTVEVPTQPVVSETTQKAADEWLAHIDAAIPVQAITGRQESMPEPPRPYGQITEWDELSEAQRKDWIAEIRRWDEFRTRLTQEHAELQGRLGPEGYKALYEAAAQDGPPTDTMAPVVETSPLSSVVMPMGYRYERLLIRTDDIPEQYDVIILQDSPVTPEAHLVEIPRPEPLSKALCGRIGRHWWVPGNGDFEERAELCAFCARQIPGVI